MSVALRGATRPREEPRSKRALLVVLLLILSTGPCGCYVRGPGALPIAVLGTAVVTAAVVSAARPPPPRVVYVPEPRRGYAWQPGYWTREDNEWVWVDGQWVELPPGYAWSPTHWEQVPDGSWQLVPGRWVAAPAP